LTRWLNHEPEHRLLVLRALGGFGKSALSWRWLMRDVDPGKWPQVVWWSFYEGNAGFEIFTAKTLYYLSGGRKEVLAPPPREQLEALLHLLCRPGVLLVLDGFERALRAYTGLDAAYQGDEPRKDAAAGEGELHQRDCASPMAEVFLRYFLSAPGIRGKTLMTTRLRPRAVELPGAVLLEGCREAELTRMEPEDAVTFFQAQGVRGGRAEIEQACAPYGYHPLCLRLLACLIAGDLEKPGDIAAARGLDITGDIIQRRHHVLQQAHDNLGPGPRSLLGRIACFRGPVEYDALKDLAENGKNALNVGLRDL
ncbi:MAG: hypothetical protein GY859_37285, partial [Desulfobacterales bacterium]|nr:hypothetical protein [Desulfobacterales bacterium]